MGARCGDQLYEIGRGRDVAGEQASGVREARAAHAELCGLVVHRLDERPHAVRPGAPERGRGAVVRGRERGMQQVMARQHRADRQVRGRALDGVAVLDRDLDQLVEREFGFEDHHRGHEFGKRGDRARLIDEAAVERHALAVVPHQRHARAQRQLLRFAVADDVGGADGWHVVFDGRGRAARERVGENGNRQGEERAQEQGREPFFMVHSKPVAERGNIMSTEARGDNSCIVAALPEWRGVGGACRRTRGSHGKRR